MSQFCFKSIRVFLSLVFLSVFAGAKGQSTQTSYGTVTISSPNSASLGKYGDIPVGFHTAIPDVNIPLYTVEAGPLQLPISIGYHLSGLKVAEPASWVGAGWALNAGGMITRTVIGAPDEAGNSNTSEADGHFSNNGFNSYLYINSQNGWMQDYQSFASGLKDGQPDLYTFNFNGYTGKFYFRDDRTPILVPEQDLQIIPSFSGGRSIDYFTVVTPDGSQYVFGNAPGVSGTVPIEVTNVYSAKSGLMDAPPTSSWYLCKVVSADKQFAINLTYQAESYGYFTSSTFDFDKATITNSPIPGVDLVKNIIQGVRLSQISFPNGTVTFTPGSVRTDLSDATLLLDDNVNTSAVALAGIKITDGGSYCKNYNFSYSYFTAGNTSLPTAYTTGISLTTDQQRLKLDAVQEVSCDGTVSVPPYQFTYVAPTSVPRRLSFGVDHWGYYNGQDNNGGLMPTVYVNAAPVYTGAIRDASYPQMSYGSLSQITYPTGGTTSFAGQAETETVTQTVPGSLDIASFALNYDGQGAFTQTETVTTNGNPITLAVNTTCSQYVNVNVYNSSGQQVITNYQYQGSTDYLHGYNYQYSQFFYTLPAGTYTFTCSIPSNAVGGFALLFSQPGYITQTGPVVVGGTRISSITNTDATGTSTVTNYSYTYPGGSSSAILYSQPTYIQLIRNDIVAQVGLWSASGFTSTAGSSQALGYPGDGTEYYMTPGSLRPMETVQGSEMGYLYVKVSQPGNGYSAYQYYASNEGFTNAGNNVCINSITIPAQGTPPNYPPAPLPFDSRKGELYMEQHYDNNGKLVKDVTYNPQYNTSPVLSTPAFIVTAMTMSVGVAYLGTNYSLNTVKKVSMTTTENDYGTNGGHVTTTKTTTYGSNFHNQPTMTQSSTSTGELLTTKYQYAADFRLSSCDAISDCSTEYNNTCAACLTTYNTARTNCGNSSSCLTAAYTSYGQCTANARISYVSCRSSYMGTGSGSFSSCHSGAESSADGLLKPVLLLQDNNMNPVIETSGWRGSVLLHSNYTDYSPYSTPGNFPYPNQTELVNLQAPSSGFMPATVSGSSISRDSRYLVESSFLFNSGNPFQVTPHNGVLVSYLWDYQNIKPIAKVTGTSWDQIAYTSFETSGTGGIYLDNNGTGIIATDAITGSSCYQINYGLAKFNLDPGKTYVVSMWAKNGTPSYNGFNGSTQTVATTNVWTTGKTVNGWTYIEKAFANVTTINVGGGGGLVDEVRFYPLNAQMETYTYSPLLGITSQCDAANRISYYSYDALGRLIVVKDQDGNIVKTYQYHYKGQSIL